MKIRELAKRTNVPKETIHYYIREGLLRKPRKTGKNLVSYPETYVDQIRIIRGLQDNYYLPLSVIKKILRRLKKESKSKQSALQLLSEHFRPIDHLITKDITGTDAFLSATGLGKKWLHKMAEWGIITADTRNGKPIYSGDDVIIAKLLVEMDRMGFGPKDGYDPKVLKHYAGFFSQLVTKEHVKYWQENLEHLSSEDLLDKGARFTEIMGLFLYCLYRKLVHEGFLRFYRSVEKEKGLAPESQAKLK